MAHQQGGRAQGDQQSGRERDADDQRGGEPPRHQGDQRHPQHQGQQRGQGQVPGHARVLLLVGHEAAGVAHGHGVSRRARGLHGLLDGGQHPLPLRQLRRGGQRLDHHEQVAAIPGGEGPGGDAPRAGGVLALQLLQRGEGVTGRPVLVLVIILQVHVQRVGPGFLFVHGLAHGVTEVAQLSGGQQPQAPIREELGGELHLRPLHRRAARQPFGQPAAKIQPLAFVLAADGDHQLGGAAGVAPGLGQLSHHRRPFRQQGRVAGLQLQRGGERRAGAGQHQRQHQGAGRAVGHDRREAGHHART